MGMNLSNNIIGFHHVSIKANNFEETLLFYQKLGFQEVHRWSLPAFNLDKCVMLKHQAIGYHLEICDKDADIPTQGRKREVGDPYIENALLHICFTVKDAEEARKKALEIGATDLSNGVFTLDLVDGEKTVNVRNSLVYSPNGEVIEFLEQTTFG